MIFSPARSGRDNTTKHTYDNIKEVKEVVINIVNFPMVEQMSLASTAYAKGVNEFEKAGFTAIKSEKVRPPRVKESPVSFECEVDRIIELGDGPGAGNLILARVVLMHIREEYMDAIGQLDTEKLDLIGRMGGIWYSRANKESLFEIPKPIITKGIGVDQLPEGIRNSKVLTGNNLGRLGNLEFLPTPLQVSKIENHTEIVEFINKNLTREVLRKKIHQIAKEKIENGETEEALVFLMWLEEY
jgi:flavin reductase (DIM6/NTAB) family NADH-FMN oxidoreductase RutF